MDLIKRDHPDPVLSDIISPLQDFLLGDEELAAYIQEPDRAEKIQKALDFLLNNPALSDQERQEYLKNSWRIVYRRKPPTPEEFLSRKYLGKMADEIYPKVRTAFIQFMDPTKPYRNLILYPHIGWGKSTLSALVTIFIAVHISLMRNPKTFFKQAQSSVLAQVLVSFTQQKASQVLLAPLLNILESSEYFHKCQTREQMVSREKEFLEDPSVDTLFWTRATPNGAFDLQFANGSFVKVCSRPTDYLGLNIVSGTLTELSFFREAGKSDDYILRVYNDLLLRIESRMKGDYYGRSILDTSPNDLESPIDSYIVNEAYKNPKNYIVKGARWDFEPEEFDMADLFPVFKGGHGKPPAILDAASAHQYDPSTLIWVPASYSSAPGRGEVRALFENDLVKALKDMAGVPSGSIDKLFYYSAPVEGIFSPYLRNIYTYITAPEDQNPVELIWRQVAPTLFTQSLRTIFWYQPHLPRYLHVDQSVSGDMTGIACAHREFTESGEEVLVIDFTIAILPLGGRINLEAIGEFILDLVKKGNMFLRRVTFDQFQSEATIQKLKREGLNVGRLSVDESPAPYLELVSLIQAGRVKVGKNIILKNNLLSLRVTRTPRSQKMKIDHTSGEVLDPRGDVGWTTSLLGRNAKDLSDAVCGAVLNCRTDTEAIPTGGVIWSEEKLALAEQTASSKEEKLKYLLSGFSR